MNYLLYEAPFEEGFTLLIGATLYIDCEGGVGGIGEGDRFNGDEDKLDGA